MEVSSSPTDSETNKTATDKNYSLKPSSGAKCLINPMFPPPCQPSTSVMMTGQSVLNIDSGTALADTCMFQCAKGGVIMATAPGQSIMNDSSSSAKTTEPEKGGQTEEREAEEYKTEMAKTAPEQSQEAQKGNNTVPEKSQRQENFNQNYNDDFQEPVTNERRDGTDRTREVFRRKDIDWNLKRPNGKTNLEAAKQDSSAPIRYKSDGKPEPVELHHHNQDKDGPLVELWQSQHRKVPNTKPPPSWRKQFPEEAENFWLNPKNIGKIGP